MGFKAYLIDKMQELVMVQYQLYSYRINYIKIFQKSWTFLDLIPSEVYDMTISII